MSHGKKRKREIKTLTIDEEVDGEEEGVVIAQLDGNDEEIWGERGGPQKKKKANPSTSSSSSSSSSTAVTTSSSASFIRDPEWDEEHQPITIKKKNKEEERELDLFYLFVKNLFHTKKWMPLDLFYVVMEFIPICTSVWTVFNPSDKPCNRRVSRSFKVCFSEDDADFVLLKKEFKFVNDLLSTEHGRGEGVLALICKHFESLQKDRLTGELRVKEYLFKSHVEFDDIYEDFHTHWRKMHDSTLCMESIEINIAE